MMYTMWGSRHIRGSLEANRTVKDAIEAAVSRRSDRRRIAVTDLVNPRQAYCQRTYPEMVPSEEKRRLMTAGAGFHDLFGRAVSSEEFVEQFVEYEGIVGKIDIYDDVPTEVKTTGFVPADPGEERPSYVDQLGLYCAMTDQPVGRLVLCRRKEYGREPLLRVWQVSFGDLDTVRANMVLRRDLLTQALETGDPSGLPACEWYGRQCDYQQVCGCGTAKDWSRAIEGCAADLVREREEEDRLEGLLAAAGEQTLQFRLNDLVFPRRAYFEAREGEEKATSGERLAGMQRHGFDRTLGEAIRYGFRGEYVTTPVRVREIGGRVGLFRSMPTIIRVNHWTEMIARDELPWIQPHYFDRLALECAATGIERGRLILYYERVVGQRLMVYEAAFRDLGIVRAEAERRADLLLSGAAAGEFPACPGWMARMCDYRETCGCAAS